MGREYAYDQSGVFYYFLLSLLVMYLIPTTFYKVSKWTQKDGSSSSSSSSSSADDEHSKIIKAKEQLKKKNEKKKSFGISDAVWVCAWIAFFFVAYAASQVQSEEAVAWDPYKILGLEIGASQADIKAAYKSLSLKWHPDKNKGNEEEAQLMFVDISKAYKTLTDDETRESWEKYGNPDNIKDITVGIALPEWIVRKENRFIVLGIYILAMLIIVSIVGYWWFGSKKGNSNEVSQKNVNWIAGRLLTLMRSKAKSASKNTKSKSTPPLHFTLEEIVKELYITPEYQDGLKFDPETEKDFIEEWTKKKLEGFQIVEKNIKPELRKALFFLYIHVSRLEVPEKYNEEYLMVVQKSVRLLKMMTSISLQLKCLSACQKTIMVQQFIMQAIWDKEPLRAHFKQLPFFDQSMLNNFLVKKEKDKITSVGKLMALPEDVRRSTLGKLNDQEYSEFMEAASQIPIAEFKTISFKVLNENDIRVGDTVTVSIKIRVSYGPTHDRKEESVEEVEEVEEPITKKPVRPDLNKVLPVYAPKFPEVKYPCWWIVISNDKEMIVGFNLANEYTTAESIKEGTIVDTKIQFKAFKSGKNQFRVHAMSDSFIGCDIMKDVDVNILESLTKEELEEMNKGKDEEEEEEEEEEESIFSMGNKKDDDPASDSEDEEDDKQNKKNQKKK